jgi:hypothetical protein
MNGYLRLMVPYSQQGFYNTSSLFIISGIIQDSHQLHCFKLHCLKLHCMPALFIRHSPAFWQCPEKPLAVSKRLIYVAYEQVTTVTKLPEKEVWQFRFLVFSH